MDMFETIMDLLLNGLGMAALAIFAIWMLKQSYAERAQMESEAREREQRESNEARQREVADRERLIGVVDRNTAAWAETTKVLAELSVGMAAVVEAVNRGGQESTAIRLLLARRPCVADHALKQVDQG
jgi:hypothetical protein